MANSTAASDEIVRRLDILIALALNFSSAGNEVSITAKMKVLAALGLNPAEVGRILGKPTNYVSAVLGTRKVKRHK